MRIKTSRGIIRLPDGISAEDAEKAIASLDNLPLPTFFTTREIHSLPLVDVDSLEMNPDERGARHSH